MKITKLDVLIILIILIWLYFSFTSPKYFEIKGQDLFGAIMTYDTLHSKGFGVKADITGIGFEAQRLVKVSGIVLDTTGEKMYIWDGDTLHVIYQKTRFLEIKKIPETPYLYPSSITLHPSEDFRIVQTEECGRDSFSSEVVYIVLDKPASEVFCSYLSRRVWEGYGGEIECEYGGSQIKLTLTLLRKFEPASLSQLISEFGYDIEKTWSSGRDCLMIEYQVPPS